MGKKKAKPDKSNQKAARKAFFEKGGTPKQWIGSPSTFVDKKKEANKNASRRPVSDD